LIHITNQAFCSRFQANKLPSFVCCKETGLSHYPGCNIYVFYPKYKKPKNSDFPFSIVFCSFQESLVIVKNQKTSFVGISTIKHRYWFFLTPTDDLVLFFSVLTFKIYLIRINARNLKKLFATLSYISKTINTFVAFFLNIFFIKALFIYF
jgi:hypothetical protein